MLDSDPTAGWPLQRAQATLVCGAAGAGKSSYVAAHLERGDLVLDFDYITAALSGLLLLRDRDHEPPAVHDDEPACLLPFACQARDAVISRLANGTSRVKRAWIVVGGATKAERWRYGSACRSRVVILATPLEECLRRLRAAGRPHLAHYERAAREWWRAYEPDAAAETLP